MIGVERFLNERGEITDDLPQVLELAEWLPVEKKLWQLTKKTNKEWGCDLVNGMWTRFHEGDQAGVSAGKLYYEMDGLVVMNVPVRAHSHPDIDGGVEGRVWVHVASDVIKHGLGLFDVGNRTPATWVVEPDLSAILLGRNRELGVDYTDDPVGKYHRFYETLVSTFGAEKIEFNQAARLAQLTLAASLGVEVYVGESVARLERQDLSRKEVDLVTELLEK